MSKKDNGDDLNNWSLEELTQIVKEFTKSQNVEENVENDKKDNQVNEEIKTENKEKIEKFNAEENKNFKDIKI